VSSTDHLADTKSLNASEQHYLKKSTDFGFSVNLRQTKVKAYYRKNAEKPDTEHQQPGDATTLKYILNEYGKDGEVLGLVVGYSGEACRMFIVSRTSKPPDWPRSTSTTSGRRRQSQRRCKPSAFVAPGVTPLHVDSRGSSWIACGTTWTRRPALVIRRASWTLTLSSTFSTHPRQEKAVLNSFACFITG
jgi:hypothetical protein